MNPEKKTFHQIQLITFVNGLWIISWVLCLIKHWSFNWLIRKCMGTFISSYW